MWSTQWLKNAVYLFWIMSFQIVYKERKFVDVCFTKDTSEENTYLKKPKKCYSECKESPFNMIIKSQDKLWL